MAFRGTESAKGVGCAVTQKVGKKVLARYEDLTKGCGRKPTSCRLTDDFCIDFVGEDGNLEIVVE
jgi:hypothetical protein